VWVYIDQLRILRFAYVQRFFAEEEKTSEADFISFLLTDFQTALQALEGFLRSSEVTHEHKEKIKKATNLVSMKSKSLVSIAREGFSANSDFYRLGPNTQAAQKGKEKSK